MANFLFAVAFATTAFTLSYSADDGNNPPSLVGPEELKAKQVAACAKKDYKTVKIGDQTWMAENLNCDAIGSVCYGNDEVNCNKYGRLYDWETAMSVCPKGWHLPSKSEWEVMTAYIGGAKTEGKKLKAKSGWNSGGNGTDEFGFSAFPGGSGRSVGSFSSAGDRGYWWSASEGSSTYAYCRYVGYYGEGAYWDYYGKSYLLSVRCVKD